MPRKYLIVFFFMAFAPPLAGQGLAYAQQPPDPCPPECVTDSLEIETYYPSPYGYYEELRGDKIIVGDTDNSHIDETHLPPSGTITFEPMLDDPDASDGSLYEGSLYYQGAIGGTKGKFRFYDGSDWQDLGGGGDYWKPSTANTDDIYYNTGNVGIGVGASDAIGAKMYINSLSGTKGLVVKSGIMSTESAIINYSTNRYDYEIPFGVTQVTVEAYGAKGGGSKGGLGGKAVATITGLTPGEVLYVYVGGSDGWNGGGDGRGSADRVGGGASDVRRGGINLANRIIVAGGGGGTSSSNNGGGSGGGLIGGVGESPGGGGGTQSVGGTGCGFYCGNEAGNGSLGTGGMAGQCFGLGGGGGGGYYGGGGGDASCGGVNSGAGGGGGSSYIISTAINALTASGVRSGNGMVIISPQVEDNLTEWQDVSGNILNLIDNNGNLAIGSPSASGYKFYVNGSAYVTSGAWSASDMRFKENILPLENPLDKILCLQGVSFEWNKVQYPQMNFEDNRQIGLIGQEVEKVIPEIVHTDSQGYKSIAYDKLGAVTIEAIKEQQKEIEQLKEANRNQQKAIELLMADKENKK